VHVLLVEDDPGIATSSRDGLIAAGFSVDHVSNGAAALTRATQGGIDVIVLDLGLPDMDGQDVAREVRKTSQVPIVVISARGDEVDRVVALELGADDYLVKPFGLRELVARIRAVTRRAGAAPDATAAAPASGAQDLGRLVIDRRAQRVQLDGSEVNLTAKEFGVLAFLAEDPGALRRRTEILERVWDDHWYGPTKTVDAHVAAIRKKLGDSAWVEAVRGVGFRLGSPA
jgi:DNA-binding response OmpR family regulator